MKIKKTFIFAIMILAMGLSACTEARLAAHLIKRIPSVSTAQGPAGYKIGKPYRIAGVWYTPREDFNYDETGIASWYGSAFHGKPTANGERYDMYAMTAAHK
ncbi:MAG: septal ring lytic transglycosylase RlpA family protein, partial [Pseudomonadota bacterium]|nr:septal ring lytic transglycosylase RlpA family protein [Pseudomonadota bacterium]